MVIWYLEGVIDSDGNISRRHLSSRSMTIGRDSTADISVVWPGVSRFHARVDLIDGTPIITDLQSTNGTFVNHERITQPTRLGHGDVVHLAELEMRIINKDGKDQAGSGADEDYGNETVFFSEKHLSQTFPTGVRELEALLQQRALDMHFQPIFRSATRVPYGYEVLGRGAWPGIPSSPLSLFAIAESVGLETRLSELMRRTGVENAAKQGLKGHIFINTHPSEMLDQDALLASLFELRQTWPAIPLVFEVHEQAVAAVDSLRLFKEELKKIGIRFAFDDFGVGQSRLLELLEAQPDIVKFDRSLIAGIEAAETNQTNLLRRLVDFAHDYKIETLAEGVETRSEFDACVNLGFELFQGYFLGRPAPASEL